MLSVQPLCFLVKLAGQIVKLLGFVCLKLGAGTLRLGGNTSLFSFQVTLLCFAGALKFGRRLGGFTPQPTRLLTNFVGRRMALCLPDRVSQRCTPPRRPRRRTEWRYHGHRGRPQCW